MAGMRDFMINDSCNFKAKHPTVLKHAIWVLGYFRDALDATSDSYHNVRYSSA